MLQSQPYLSPLQVAAMGASVANAGLSGNANAAGAMLTGAAYQLNGAVASASMAATYAYLKSSRYLQISV